MSTAPISSSCSENELLWGKTIPSPRQDSTGKNHRSFLSPKTSCTLLIVPRWNPRLSCTKFGRKMGALNDSRVVWFLETRYKWYPNKDMTDMQNIPLTKKRNNMWNLKNIKWEFIYFSVYFQTVVNISLSIIAITNYNNNMLFLLATLKSLLFRWPVEQEVF